MVIIYHAEYGVGHLVNADDLDIPALRTKEAIVGGDCVVVYFPSRAASDKFPIINKNKLFELDWTTMFRREPE